MDSAGEVIDGGDYLYAADENLQNNLIRALCHLQDRELDAVFADKPATQREVAQPYFGFSISGEQFVVNARHFCEVFTDIPIAPLPNAPALLLGLANLRGLLLPVYQLHFHLQRSNEHRVNSELQKSQARKKVVLVIGKGERAVGLLIDGLPASISLALPATADKAALPHPHLPGLAELYLLPDKTLAELQVEQLPERLLDMAGAIRSSA